LPCRRKKAVIVHKAGNSSRRDHSRFRGAGRSRTIVVRRFEGKRLTTESPLGKTLAYPVAYAPDLLFPIERSVTRHTLGIGDTLPFRGVDIWNAWDLTWLGSDGRPEVATAEIVVPADSTHIVESKSLKLYLGSLAMTHYDTAEHVAAVIADDLETVLGAEADVVLRGPGQTDGRRTRRMPGECLDRIDADCEVYEVDSGLLEISAGEIVREDLYSNLLRSLCPVTGQPDLASVLVSYAGPRIERESLLRYLVSYRLHADYHENCVERMFTDITERCRPEGLSIYARYQRRGGIDINPFRSDFEAPPKNLRLWRQ